MEEWVRAERQSRKYAIELLPLLIDAPGKGELPRAAWRIPIQTMLTCGMHRSIDGAQLLESQTEADQLVITFPSDTVNRTISNGELFCAEGPGGGRALRRGSPL